jgi:hypothetical protein
VLPVAPLGKSSEARLEIHRSETGSGTVDLDQLDE